MNPKETKPSRASCNGWAYNNQSKEDFFMNVKIQSVKFDADKKLIDFIESKMDKLDRFVERATSAEVILKLDKDPEQGNKVATIKIEVPTDTIIAEHQSKSFEESVDGAIDAIKKQLEKHKEKFAK